VGANDTPPSCSLDLGDRSEGAGGCRWGRLKVMRWMLIEETGIVDKGLETRPPEGKARSGRAPALHETAAGRSKSSL